MPSYEELERRGVLKAQLTLPLDSIGSSEQHCCDEGRKAFRNLLYSLRMAGIGHATDDPERLDYQRRRCDMVDVCTVLTTGICALEASGILPAVPIELDD
jgi:hypothetical protein